MIYQQGCQYYAVFLSARAKSRQLIGRLVKQNRKTIQTLILCAKSPKLSFEYYKIKDTLTNEMFAAGIAHARITAFFNKVGIR